MKRNGSTYAAFADEDLAARVAQRDTVAFEELYKRYHRRMQFFFYRMLGHSEEKSRDFLQDLFLKLIEKPHLYNPKKKFSTWFFSVAYNMCKNEYRRLKVRQVMDPDGEVDVAVESGPDAARHTDLNAFQKQLYAELDNMDESRKTAFLLRHREGFSIKEISQVLECSEGTVKSKVFYTNKKLSLALRAYHPNGEDYLKPAPKNAKS